MEQLEGDSLKRYDKITTKLIDLGYKIQDGYPKKDSEGLLEWVFLDSNGDEEKINESNFTEHSLFNSQKRWKKMEEERDKIITPEYLREVLFNKKPKISNKG